MPGQAHCRAALLLVFASLALGTAEIRAGDIFPLDYPPLVTLIADQASTLQELAGRPHVAKLLGAIRYQEGDDKSLWEQFPGLGLFPPKAFSKALQTHKATALTCHVFWSAGQDVQVLFSMHVPTLGTETSLKAVLDRMAGLGTDGSEDLATKNATGKIFAYQLNEGHRVWAVRRGRTALIASDKAILSAFTTPAKRLRPERVTLWRTSLLKALHLQTPGLRIWLNAERLVDVLQQIAFDNTSREVMLTVLNQLQIASIKLPPAAILACLPEEDGVKISLRLLLHHEPGLKQNRSLPPTPPLRGAFPAEAEAVVELQLDAAASSGASPAVRDLTCGKGVWGGILAVGDTINPQSAEQYALAMHALSLLVGIHPDRDILAHLGRRACFGQWMNSKPRRAWGLVIDVKDAAKLARTTRRAEVWGRYFADRGNRSLEVTPLSLDGPLYAAGVSCPEEGIDLALVLTPAHLVIASSSDDAAQVLAGLDDLQPEPASPYWLSWRLNFSPARQLQIANLLSLWLEGGAQQQDPVGGTARRLILHSNLLSVLPRMEVGAMGGEEGALVMNLQGPLAPMGVASGSGVVAATFASTSPLHRSQNAARAIQRMRSLLQAEQMYYHLRLGQFNGAGPGRTYTATLRDLMTGKSESGALLSSWYDRIFVLDEDLGYTFSDIVLALADQQRDLSGYTFRTVQMINGKPVDLSRSWRLMATPMYRGRHTRDPVLIMDETGRVFWRFLLRAEVKAIQSLPPAPLQDGWSEWR